MKWATVEAPANIALVKYWGARDLERAIPHHPSISITLRACNSTTTVEHDPEGSADEIWLATGAGELVVPPESFRKRAVAHLQRIREWAGAAGALRAATRNSFPMSAGMASSASGFAALTVAGAAALGLERGPAELSSLARSSGSGSAARSVMGGYVEWPSDPDDEACAAVQLAPARHWDLRNVIAVVHGGAKKISSLDGHVLAETSPHYARRREILPDRLQAVRDAIAARSLGSLGPIVEEDAIELHLVAMSSTPPIFYWAPATLTVLATVRELRERGILAYSTMDAGPNVHVICEPEGEDAVAETLAALEGVETVIRDGVGDGPRLLEESLL